MAGELPKGYKWHGNIDGMLVFDLPVYRELAVFKFLSMMIFDGDDRFNDSLLAEMRANPWLENFKAAVAPYIPFAKVAGSISEEEANNPYNVSSTLAFERESKAVFLLPGFQADVIRVADTFTDWMANTQYLPDD